MDPTFFMSERCKVLLIQAPLADGQTDPDSSVIDMAADGGWDGCLFVGVLGAITGSGTVELQVKAADTETVGSAITGAVDTASGSGDSNKLLLVDVLQPAKRYLSSTLTRATANSVYGGTLAILYRGKVLPIAQLAAMLAGTPAKVAYL